VKCLVRVVLLVFLAMHQLLCWVHIGPPMFTLLWFPTFVILVLIEWVFAVFVRTPIDSAERMRRRVGWALGAFALIIPFFFWQVLAPVILAIILLRSARSGIWRFAVPLGLAVMSFAAFAVFQPSTRDIGRGILFEWGLLPAGMLLLAHVIWLARTGSQSQDGPETPTVESQR
jgi:hypothetical protein